MRNCTFSASHLVKARGVCTPNKSISALMYTVRTPKIMFLSLGEGHSCFSFLRFINLAPSEACSIMTKDIAFRFMFLLLLLEDAYRLYHRRLWNDGAQQTRYVHCSKFAFIAFASTHSTNALLLNNTVQYIMHCHTIYYYVILSYTIPHAIPCHTIYHTVSYYVYTIPHAMPYHTIYHTIYTLYSAIPHAMSYQAEPCTRPYQMIPLLLLLTFL